MKNIGDNVEFYHRRHKSCFYVKADKGSSIVIIKNDEYFNDVTSMFETGPIMQ